MIERRSYWRVPLHLLQSAAVMFARHVAFDAAQREARAYAEQWPGSIQETIFKLPNAIVDLCERVDAVEAKLRAMP